MAGMMDKAKELGNALARTDEYQALKRAVSAADDDRDIAELRSELEKLESRIEMSLRAGKEPDDDIKEAYENAVGRLQAMPTYQRLVASQANFDKVVQRVNQTIMKGLEEGAESRIILSS
ncbi:MAG TPA: YlbF family regulator [Longimicrobiales bacterium]|nr:YlbF family regulator [Longimicrobiales bacterium]